MTRWERSTRQRNCGLCGSVVAEGAPVLVVTGASGTWRLYRGSCCAGEAVPDLPAYVRSYDRTPKMVKLARVELPFDWRARAAGVTP